MAEKKTTTKKAAAPAKAAEAKKATVKKAAAPKKAALVVNAENAGFKAGDVYQALAAAQQRSARRRLCSVWVGSSRRVSSPLLTRRSHLLNHLEKA